MSNLKLSRCLCCKTGLPGPAILWSVIILLLVGCATPPSEASIRPIQWIYADRLGRLSIGMSLENFRQLFPEAYPAGQKGDTTAFELSHKQVIEDKRRALDASLGLYTPQTIINDQKLWFYFYSARLVQWGRPQDWPDRPDLIIEKRMR